jgi:hypothetical protein
MPCVPALLYHHVAPDREVTPEGFDRQMARLREDGWRCLSAAELSAHLSGEAPAPERSLLITIDDGYADAWVYAYPALRKHGMRAILFVVTSRVRDGAPRRTCEEGGSVLDTRQDERGPEGFLNWAELRAMAESGVAEVGSHTHTHAGFVDGAEYGDISMELDRSRVEIEMRIPAWSGAIAWPWGRWREEWIREAKAAGYRLAFTTQVGPNLPGTSPFRVQRCKVQGDDVSWLGSRLWLYGHPLIASAYSRLYGLDRRVKDIIP